MGAVFGEFLKAIGGGARLGFVTFVVGAVMLGLNQQKVVDLNAVGAWAPALAWLVFVAGGLLLVAVVTEWAWKAVRAKRAGVSGWEALEQEAERNLAALVEEERVYLNWLFRAEMQRFPCDVWDTGIEGLHNKRIIYSPQHSGVGVFVIRDSVWKHRQELVAQWTYIPSAFKPLGLMTESERAERARI